ncbi:hypothetical protein FQR65_LT09822 [Abscondita terminalis]|nr:hypothetical protein FQR65_LT09822 [Abscondita terminalis]
MFNEDDTLTYVFDENIEKEFPKIVKSQYVIDINKHLNKWQTNKNSAFVIRLQNQENLKKTLGQMKNAFDQRQLQNRVYVIVLNYERDLNISKAFDVFWELNLYKIALLTHRKEDMNTIGTVYTSNPFDKENFCGNRANVVHSQICDQNITIKFNTIYKSLNDCLITMYTSGESKKTTIASFAIRFVKSLSQNINSKFAIVDKTNIMFNKESAVHLRLATQTLNFFKIFDLSDVFKWENMFFVVKEENLISPVTTLFVIFKKEVWIMIVGAILITSVALWILSKNTNVSSEYQQILLNTFSATLWGNFYSIHRRREARCIVICYLIYQIHIQTGFSCNLTTVLTTPRFEPGITNIKELAESNIPLYTDLLSNYYYFKNNTNPDILYVKIKERISIINEWNVKNNIDLLKTKNSILMTDLRFQELMYSANNSIRVNKIPAISITGSVRLIIHLSFGDFFKETLNNFIRRMVESGILNKQIKNVYEGTTLRVPELKLIPLSLYHLLCAFVFLIIGLFIAGIVFAIEVGFINGYRNSNLDTCVSIVIKKMFNDGETLTYIFDENVKQEIPRTIANQYIVVSELLHLRKFNRKSLYIIRVQGQKSLNETLVRITSTFDKRQLQNSLYLILLNNHDQNISKAFEIFWKVKLYKMALLIQHKKYNKTFETVYISDPFDNENYCGSRANVIHSQNCDENITIKFDTIYKNLNQCVITMYVAFKYKKKSTSAYTIRFMQILSKKINSKLVVLDNSSFKFEEDSAVYLKIATQNIQLFKQFDLSDVFKRDCMAFVVSKGNVVSPVATLFVIFKKEVWFMIAAAIFITSLSLWIISAIHQKNDEFQQILLNVFSATLWGNFSSISKRTETRCILICYLIYQIHIHTGFSCNLTTVLTSTRFESGVTNMEELLKLNIPLYSDLNSKRYYFVNKSNSDKDKIEEKLLYISDWNTKTHIRLLKNNSAILMTELHINELLYSANNTIRVNKISTQSIFGTVRLILHLTYGDFFTKTLNDFIRKMTESGILQKELQNIYEEITLEVLEHIFIPLSLYHLLCAFVFLLIGLFIAAIVFAIEVGFREQ